VYNLPFISFRIQWYIPFCVISIQVIYNQYRCAMILRWRAYIVKTRRPKTELCGIPDKNNWTSDKIQWTDTLWERYSRQDLNHLNPLPETQKMYFNLEKTTLCSTVSTAVESSRRTSITGLPWSIDITI